MQEHIQDYGREKSVVRLKGPRAADVLVSVTIATLFAISCTLASVLLNNEDIIEHEAKRMGRPKLVACRTPHDNPATWVPGCSQIQESAHG